MENPRVPRRRCCTDPHSSSNPLFLYQTASAHFSHRHISENTRRSPGKVSMVSISRLAGFPFSGRPPRANSCCGQRRLLLTSKILRRRAKSGTGRIFFLLGTQPQSSQYIIGIGAPRYLCGDESRSLRRKLTVPFPIPFFFHVFDNLFIASLLFKPSKNRS